MSAFLSLLTAFVTLGGAFVIFHYKQWWQKKHDHYESIMSVIGDLHLDTYSYLSDLHILTMLADEGPTDIKSIVDTTEKLRVLNSKLPMAGVFISHEAAHALYNFINVNMYENDRVELYFMTEGYKEPKSFRETKLDRHNAILLQSSDLIDTMKKIIRDDLKVINNAIASVTPNKCNRL